MQITIPSQESKQFTKPSSGEIFGNLWATKNIDLEANRGKIRLSERLYRVYDSGDDADFEIPVKFIRSDADTTERWWTLVQESKSSVSDGLLFKTTATDPLTGWTQDAITFVLTGSIDPTASTSVVGVGTLFTTELIVGSRITVNGETRTVTVITDNTHLTVNSAFTDTGNDASVDAYNSPTDCVDDMEIFGQASSYDRLVVSRDTDLAMLNNGVWYPSWWDTTLAQAALTATNPHPLEQFVNLLLVVDGNVVHTIDDSLVVVASRIVLPKEYQMIWTANDGSRVYFGTRHLRDGMALVFPWDGTSKTYDQPIPVDSFISLAGVVPKSGVLHTINGKGQLMRFNGQAFDVIASLPIADKKLKWSNNVKRVEMVHPNGMTVIGNEIHILLTASTDEDVPGVFFFEEFRGGIWAFNEDIGLYNKYSLGQYDGVTNNDWGASVIRLAGALMETDLAYGRLLAGCGVYSDNASTIINSIIVSQVDTTADNRGYFITSQIQTSSIRAFWQRLHLAFKKLGNSTDRIIIKYRTDINPARRSDERLTTYGITWTDTDTFTSVGSLSTIVAGDEVEIIVGKGAGAIAHISSISFATPTYTVNLDEAIPNVSGDSYMVINRWTKLGEISSQTIQRKLYRIAKMSSWIQFKIEIRGTESSPELEKLNISLLDADLT